MHTLTDTFPIHSHKSTHKYICSSRHTYKDTFKHAQTHIHTKTDEEKVDKKNRHREKSKESVTHKIRFHTLCNDISHTKVLERFQMTFLLMHRKRIIKISIIDI